MSAFDKATVPNWLKISQRKYDALIRKAQASNVCLKPDCNMIRDDPQDLLCPNHRLEFNEWSNQFFVSVHKENITEEKTQ